MEGGLDVGDVLADERADLGVGEARGVEFDFDGGVLGVAFDVEDAGFGGEVLVGGVGRVCHPEGNLASGVRGVHGDGGGGRI